MWSDNCQECFEEMKTEDGIWFRCTNTSCESCGEDVHESKLHMDCDL
jgi:hypothetical protein